MVKNSKKHALLHAIQSLVKTYACYLVPNLVLSYVINHPDHCHFFTSLHVITIFYQTVRYAVALILDHIPNFCISVSVFNFLVKRLVECLDQ